jgi:hypothetical protein
MGGKAFLSLLPDKTFPRLTPTVYASLKSSLLPRLTPLFQYVGVPHEAPEKPDFGDVDFVVACPNADIGHGGIKNALGASACIPSAQPDGRGSHHFALRLADVVPSQTTGAEQATAETSDVYVQVDVNIRKDVQDWENAMFFHAYGDLGMIMGRLAASVGLHVGELGLKASFLCFHEITERTNVGADVVTSAGANALSYFLVVDFNAGYHVLPRAFNGTMGGGVRDAT